MELSKYIDEADMILIGIGESFQEQFENIKVENEKNITVFEEYARKKYLDEIKKDAVIDAYNILAQLLQGKNYFVITLCDDDKIFHSNLEQKRIVAPCGTYSVLQCEDVCTDEFYPLKNYEQMLEEGKEPFCPKCGKHLIMNRIGCKKYSEEWYLGKWNLYTKWLQGTLNKKLLVVEAGVGLKYPSVIRWPFEKVVFINKNAKFIRIHESLYHLTQEIKEKGIAIQENPLNFLINQIV